MSYNREYPYNDAGRMDTDWLINQVKELAEKLKDGIGYRLSIDGRVLSLIGNDGSVSRVTLPEGGGGGGGVTYGLRRNGQVIELRGSDGSVSSVPAPILTVDSHISSTSTNPVQNKAIKEALDNKADVEDIPSIPTRLPNPQALTFTGAASGSYDGTSAMTVNIPEGGGGGGGDYELLWSHVFTEDEASSVYVSQVLTKRCHSYIVMVDIVAAPTTNIMACFGNAPSSPNKLNQAKFFQAMSIGYSYASSGVMRCYEHIEITDDGKLYCNVQYNSNTTSIANLMISGNKVGWGACSAATPSVAPQEYDEDAFDYFNYGGNSAGAITAGSRVYIYGRGDRT